MGITSTGTYTVLDSHMHGAKPFLLLSVKIFSVGVTCFLARINKGFIEGIKAHIITTAGAHWSTPTAVFVFSPLPGFGLFKIR